MKLFISICLFAVLILDSQSGFSQKEIDNSGDKCLIYTAKKGETTFSICEKYKVTPAELKKANPDLTAILKAGSTIKIPIKKAVEETKPLQTTAKNIATEPEFYYHKVIKKQTIFSIAKLYDVTANELIRYNTEISNGIVVGQVLRIPVKKDETTVSPSQLKTERENAKVTTSGTQIETGFNIHLVVSGETLYSLEKKYEVTHEEMQKYNQALQNGLKAGMKLKIPVKVHSLPDTDGDFIDSPMVGDKMVLKTDVSTNPIESTPSDCLPLSGNTSQKYKVGLILTFNIQGNDQINSTENILSKIDFSKMPVVTADSTTTVVNLMNIDQHTQGFLEFYEGAVLAIDSLQQKGMNIELYVFDATNQTMINALLQLDVFRELNLIIGPVYPELQESVASFAAKNRIPMVSPLAPNGNFEVNNPYYFKVNPSKEYQIEETADYIAKEFADKNFVLLPMNGNSNSMEAKLAELGKEKLIAARQSSKTKKDLFHEYSFQKQGLNDLSPLLDKTGENIFIIPSDNEAQVSVAVTNLNALAEKYNVVLIGTSNLTKMKSIQTENYHHVRLRYLSPTFVDYTKPLVRRFVSQYRETFSGEPSQFSYQGFDVAYYFLSALYRYGKDFKNCLPTYPMELTQMDFNFRRLSPVGGYMNCGLFVTAYERNYDILNYGIAGSK